MARARRIPAFLPGLPPMPKAARVWTPREAAFQKGLVAGLRQVLLPGSLVHASPNEVREGGDAGAKKQAIALAMGILPGHSDVTVYGRQEAPDRPGPVLFMECKTSTGRPSEEQEEFRAWALRHGHHHAYVRTWDEATAALQAAGIGTRIAGGRG